MHSPIKEYYRLTKPGIIYGNTLTAAAGFFLASGRAIDIPLLLASLPGIMLVMASACVFNNYIDRGIDSKMARTKNRALVHGGIKTSHALLYGALLGFLGFMFLGLFTNLVTLSLGVVAMITYIVLYGITKRRSVHGTLVGSIAGALPPVAGYTAASNQLDLAALLLFLILVFWQMPHFYAIAIFRLNEYKAAGIPVLPAVKGLQTTRIHMLIYIAALTLTLPLLTIFDYSGWSYLIIAMPMSAWWLIKGIRSLKIPDHFKWARSMFFASLTVILGLSLAVSVGPWLP